MLVPWAMGVTSNCKDLCDTYISLFQLNLTTMHLVLYCFVESGRWVIDCREDWNYLNKNTYVPGHVPHWPGPDLLTGTSWLGLGLALVLMDLPADWCVGHMTLDLLCSPCSGTVGLRCPSVRPLPPLPCYCCSGSPPRQNSLLLLLLLWWSPMWPQFHHC